MLNFINDIPFRITPISPIHIGSGESVDWSTSIADENYLYILDFFNINLPEQAINKIKNISLNCENEEGLLELQRVYKEHKHSLIGSAHDKIALPPKLAKKFIESLGRNVQTNANNNRNNGILNKLNVSRTAFNSNNLTPYMPGSSIKGAIRTAYLSAFARREHVKRENRRKSLDEKSILRGSFATDPFRLLKIEDTISSQKNSTQVFYLVNKKRNSDKDRKLHQYLEAIIPFNYGSFRGSLRILDGTDKVAKNTDIKVTPPPLEEVINTVNKFNISMFQEQKRQLQNLHFVHQKWLTKAEELIDKMDRTSNMLIRLGKLCTAESKTVEGLRQISIRNPKKPRESRIDKHGTTFWLAGDFKSNANLLPMGWAIIELGDTKNKELQDFCNIMAESYSHASSNSAPAKKKSYNIPDNGKKAIEWLKKLLNSDKSDTKEKLAAPVIQLLKKAQKWPEDIRYDIVEILEEYDFGKRQDDIENLLDTM